MLSLSRFLDDALTQRHKGPVGHHSECAPTLSVVRHIIDEDRSLSGFGVWK